MDKLVMTEGLALPVLMVKQAALGLRLSPTILRVLPHSPIRQMALLWAVQVALVAQAALAAQAAQQATEASVATAATAVMAA